MHLLIAPSWLQLEALRDRVWKDFADIETWIGYEVSSAETLQQLLDVPPANAVRVHGLDGYPASWVAAILIKHAGLQVAEYFSGQWLCSRPGLTDETGTGATPAAAYEAWLAKGFA